MKKSKNNSKANSEYSFDVVVVGSGPAGVSAAYTLVKAGLNVAIVDGGLDSKKKDKQSDEENIVQKNASPSLDLLRKSSYVFNKTYQLLPIKSRFEIIQSLAKGGLSQIWSGICDYFSEDELKAVGLPPDEIKKEYKEVENLIKSRKKRYLDLHSKLILRSAQEKTNLDSMIYQVLVVSYNSVLTIKDLMRYKNFTYISNNLVSTLEDKGSYTEIKGLVISTSKTFTMLSRFVILAAGSINTTRILLRSLQLFNYKTTFLTKAHYLTACLHTRTLMKRIILEKLPLGQVVMSSKKKERGLDTFFIHLYRYNPLRLTRALKYIPLPKSMASFLLSVSINFLVVADIRFPAFESEKKYCVLKKNGDKDVLEISFIESKKDLELHKNEYKNIKQQLRSLGLLPLKTISGYTTSHYAGGVPFLIRPGKLSVDANGRLHQSKRIYIADSSTWRALPAKPPTLTIMANASRIGKIVAREFGYE